ncbi:ferritin [Natranaerobius thermophilus]|uniref:Ferritin n=1 Tax=Natranaerobius thermophilus (strain ATCC BAA-1301 / DSM 18059 / JW/NM-WN-LF) TaxID=457570 RepID=B2A2D2_NATTJ|nr:ferritin [Natranaerobius thermophilus]ACB86238.1 Ferritin Dps family protein [Natranaerobius thermophilus JW/NM-WN-LF]
MIPENVLQKLNEQIKHEFFSAQYYLAMAAYCKEQDLDGFANFFIVQAEEERYHAMKFFNFIDELGETPIITGFEDPKRDFKSLEEVFELSLEHEQHVTHLINSIMEIAQQEKHYPTVSFLNWFIDEQVEEETTMDNLLSKVKRIGESGPGIIMLDKELAERSFTPEEE